VDIAPASVQKIRVRISPGYTYKVFRENMAMLFCIVVDLICIVCVLKKINKGTGQKYLKNKSERTLSRTDKQTVFTPRGKINPQGSMLTIEFKERH
jgi:hypothetical protein